MKLLLILLLILPLSLSAAVVAGQVVDADTQMGVDNILVFIQRTYPNAWENIYFVSETDEAGSFTIDNATPGTYRLYTGFSDSYFTGYYDNLIQLENDTTINNILIPVEAVLTSFGSISGQLDLNDIPDDTTFFMMTLRQFVAPDNMEITHGLIELDENFTYSYENLNAGTYKLGIMFYGQFNGEIWYGGFDNMEDSPYIEITPENPTFPDMDFTFMHPDLESGYLIVDELIIDGGWDDQIDYGETIEFSLRLKNIGNDLEPGSEISIINYYPQIEFANPNEELGFVASDQYIEIGPYPLTVSTDIDDNFEFGLNYVFNGGIVYHQHLLEFVAYKPVIDVSNFNITSNSGVLESNAINSIQVYLENIGGADLQYPIVNVTSDDEQVILTDDYMTNYYVIPSGFNNLDFYFDFQIEELAYNDSLYEFTLNISNLDVDFEQEVSFVIEASATTSIAENVVNSRIELIGNYPNPFNPQTEIRFNLDSVNGASLEIYNIIGQRVKQFDSSQFIRGQNNYSISWNGKNDSGKSVPSGVYFYKLRKGSYIKTRKMVLLK